MLPSIIAGALLYTALRTSAASPSPALLPSAWLVEGPEVLDQGPSPTSAIQALVNSRRNLVDLATFSSTLILVHVWSSAWFEMRHRNDAAVAEGERRSVPRQETRRLQLYMTFSCVVTLDALLLKAAFGYFSIGIWISRYLLKSRSSATDFALDLNYYQIIIASMFYQLTLYAAIRLAHRGFTLGELGLTCFGGLTILFEMLNLTIAHVSSG
jgi:dolichol kinase